MWKRSIALSAVLITLAFTSRASAAPTQRPNIVFIVADDLGWQDVGFMGSTYFETPHLDALAKESLVFTNAFMYPTCSPSRAAILTGQQSFRTGIYCVPVLEKGTSNDSIFSKWTVGLEHPLFAEPLRDAGYKLIHLGKWHIVGPDPESETTLPLRAKLTQPRDGDLRWLSHHQTPTIQRYYPTGRGFHENVGGTWWGDPARGYAEGYRSKSGGYIAPFKNPFIAEKPDDEWLTDRLTADAIEFMKRNQGGPFFVNLQFYAPHKPSIARNPQWLERFMTKPADPVTGQGEGKRAEIAAYATMIKSIDENVKRITDYLDAAGLRENTVIIFTADNGFNGLQSVNRNLRGAKGSVYDGGLRVPAMINWPRTARSGTTSEPIHALDFFPTFLELGAIQNYGGTLDGTSLVPLIRGEAFADRPLFWHIASEYTNPPCSIIRRGKWKLIQFLRTGAIELYDTEADAKESTNLADTDPTQAQALLKELTAWRQANRVPLPPSSRLDH